MANGLKNRIQRILPAKNEHNERKQRKQTESEVDGSRVSNEYDRIRLSPLFKRVDADRQC